jgi:predicted tellurium resistance membrane protein TerC
MDIVIALVALTVMEIVLGIDNIVFIAILAGRLPAAQRGKARTLGLAVALITRVLLLLSIKWILGLKEPLFHLSDFLPDDWFGPELLPDHSPAATTAAGHHPHLEINAVSMRDLILLAGGLFLIGKSVVEIHHKIEGDEHHREARAAGFLGVVVQIAILDIVFSLDSVITAVGMVSTETKGAIYIMIAAIVMAIGVMLVFAGRVSEFIDRHPTLKILALSFLILIGVMLVAEGIGTHINKGYVYFAMAFSVIVEMLNLKMRSKAPSPPAATG